jgi:hypothetical protein
LIQRQPNAAIHPPVDKEFYLKPLREKQRIAELKMDVLTHVVLDRSKSSRADQDTQILMSVSPYFMD